MNNRQDEILIFKYASARTFLIDFFKQKKMANENFSIGLWAKKLNLSSTASLSRILSGDRNPGEKITSSIVKYFNFNEKQSIYFRLLTELDKNKNNPALSVIIMEQLKKLNPNNKFHYLDHASFEAIANWYFYAIREMTRQVGFKEDYEWIVEQLNFKVTITDVKKAIQILLDVKLLTRVAGKLTCSEDNIDWKSDLVSEASKRNHEQNLENAKVAIRNIDIYQREFNSVCFTMNSRNIAKAKKKIREFRDEFMNSFEEDGDITYQMQVQFFPFTKLIKIDAVNNTGELNENNISSTTIH